MRLSSRQRGAATLESVDTALTHMIPYIHKWMYLGERHVQLLLTLEVVGRLEGFGCRERNKGEGTRRRGCRRRGKRRRRRSRGRRLLEKTCDSYSNSLWRGGTGGTGGTGGRRGRGSARKRGEPLREYERARALVPTMSIEIIHTHTHTHTHTRKLAHTHARTHARARAHTHTPT